MVAKNHFIILIIRSLLIINLGMAISYPLLWLAAGKQELFWRADFTVYYTGATIIRSEGPGHLYNLEFQTEVQQSILSGKSFKDGLLPYNYPPYVALFFSPFVAIPLASAYKIFAIFQLIFIVVWLWMLSRLAEGWHRNERIAWMVSILAYPPVLVNLLLGNLALLTTLSITLAYLALKKNRFLLSYIGLALALAKPQLAIVPVLITGLQSKKKQLLKVLSAAVVLFMLSFLIFPLKIWREYFTILLDLGSLSDFYGIVARDMFNLRGAIVLIFGESSFPVAHILNLTAFLLSIAVITIQGFRRETFSVRSFDLFFSFSLLLGMLFAPHIYPQDNLLLVLPAFIFYNHKRSLHQLSPALVIFLLSSPLLYGICEILHQDRLPFHWPFIAMVILAVWVIYTYRENRRESMIEAL